MSNVLRAVDHLKQVNVELTHSEKCSTMAVSVKEVQDFKSSVQEQVMPHRSKRIRKYIDYQEAMIDTQEQSVVVDNCTAKGGKKKRKTRDALESSSKKPQKRLGGMDAVASPNDTAGNKVRKGQTMKRKKGQKSTFEERCEELIEFKDEFGHCNVPAKYSANIPLGWWCHKTRYNYNQKRHGKPTLINISQDQIKCLEEIGFQWKICDHEETFQQRCRDLEAFKSVFGHSVVPRSYCEDPSLGRWCSTLRYTYRQIQKGKSTSYNLCQDRIERLEGIGFRWEV